MPDEAEEVEITAWLSDGGDGELIERGLALAPPNYKCVLSLLWIRPSDDD